MKVVLLLVLCILNGRYSFRLTHRHQALSLLRPDVRRPSTTTRHCSATPALESAATALVSKPTQDYDWEKKWYAVCFEENFPSVNALPLAYSVFGRPLVLWRDEEHRIRCVTDKCPHRAAKLSEGRVRDGKIECLYHGWQFDGGSGRCTLIPQLEERAMIPSLSCVVPYPVEVHEGIVWVYMDASTPSDALPPIPSSIGFELGEDMKLPARKRTYQTYDFQIDLPYDHSFLVENLIDPAHIPISHDRTSGGGMRENAQPYEMVVDEESFCADGFTARFRETRQPKPWTEIKMEAPGIVRYRSVVKAKDGSDIQFSAALHCMPLGIGRSRLLFRTYFKGLPWIAAFILGLKPKWLRHLNSCKVLEQDVGLITTQEDWLAGAKGVSGGAQSLSQQYLPLRSSDLMVVAYRRWLDAVSDGMPWCIGWTKIKMPDTTSSVGRAVELAPSLNRLHRSTVETRFQRHVVHSRCSRDALQNIHTARGVSALLGGVSLALATVRRQSLLCVAASALSSLIWIGLTALEQQFYVSYDRKKDLSTNKI